jgi:hypothetical protein
MVAHTNIWVPTRRLVLPGDPDFEWPDGERVWEGRLSPEWFERPLWRALVGDWPVPRTSKVLLFGPTGTSGAAYFPWFVPRSDGTAMLLAVNGGAGGGGGRTDVAGTQRQGGGGGCSGSWGRILVPLRLLPPVLYSRAGAGGPGGAASTNGTANTFSDWVVYPDANSDSDSQDTILRGGGVGTGGAGGTTAAGTSAGGTGGTAPASTFWNTLGFGFTAIAGINGTGGKGGNGSSPGAPAIFVTSPFHQGVGGGAVTNANADSAGLGFTATTAYGFPPSGGANPGGDGSNGFMSDWQARGTDAFWALGGCGGGGNAGGTGGKGGQGAWGCGGGGGGAGTTGGIGGSGGDGFCMALTF